MLNVSNKKLGTSQILLVTLTFLCMVGLLLVPLILIFYEALQAGLKEYLFTLLDSDARSAILLTLITAICVVPLNLCFGIASAWLIARFQFPGRKLILSLMDIPLAVSPVIAGMIFILLYGPNGLLGPFLNTLDIKIIFALPGIVLATTFITLPYVARELIPIMLSQGSSDEEAALTLGARGWQVFWHITLPNIKWGLLYGVILCNARAMGEFGAVSVVSGHIRGLTNTMPLHIEILFNEYNMVGSFALSSLLTMLAIVTLLVKNLFHFKRG